MMFVRVAMVRAAVVVVGGRGRGGGEEEEEGEESALTKEEKKAAKKAAKRAKKNEIVVNRTTVRREVPEARVAKDGEEWHAEDRVRFRKYCGASVRADVGNATDDEEESAGEDGSGKGTEKVGRTATEGVRSTGVMGLAPLSDRRVTDKNPTAMTRSESAASTRTIR